MQNPQEKTLKALHFFQVEKKALTAIAILFAILKMRQCHLVCLMKLKRHLMKRMLSVLHNILESLQKSTQFIVITHRKTNNGTCQTLCGAMEEEGVSRMVKC